MIRTINNKKMNKKGFGVVQSVSILLLLLIALFFIIFAAFNSSKSVISPTALNDTESQLVKAVVISTLRMPVKIPKNIDPPITISNPTLADIIALNKNGAYDNIIKKTIEKYVGTYFKRQDPNYRWLLRSNMFSNSLLSFNTNDPTNPWRTVNRKHIKVISVIVPSSTEGLTKIYLEYSNED